MNRFVFWAIFCLVSLVARSEAPTPLHFEMVVRKDSPMGQKVFESLDRVLKKHQFSLAVEEYPSLRGIQEMRRGRVDGSLGRVGDLEKLHDIKGYVRLKVPLMVYTVSLWCSKTPKEVMLLKNPRVAYYSGNIFAMRTAQLIQDKSIIITEIKNLSSLHKLMEKDRLDCLLSSDIILDKVGVTKDSLKPYSKQLLIASPAYPWISNKYANLVEILEKELGPERQELYLKHWQEEWKAHCPIEFNRICPDGRVFKKPLTLPEDWRYEQIWEVHETRSNQKSQEHGS